MPLLLPGKKQNKNELFSFSLAKVRRRRDRKGEKKISNSSLRLCAFARGILQGSKYKIIEAF